MEEKTTRYCKRCEEEHSKWKYRKAKYYWQCLKCYKQYGKGTARAANKELNNGVYRCASCSISSPTASFFDVDHIIPKSQGGSNKATNLQLLCPNCHRIKTMKDNNELIGKDLRVYQEIKRYSSLDKASSPE